MAKKARRPLSVSRSYQNPSKQLSYFEKADALTIEEGIARFMAMKQTLNLRPKTITLYRKYLRYFNEWRINEYPQIERIDEVTRKMVEEYLHHSLVKCELSPHTVNGRLRMLKTFYNALKDDGEDVESPAEKVAPLKVNESTLRVYTDDQVKRLLDSCDTRSYVGLRDYCYLLLALDSGMRITETLMITISDIDFDNRTISVVSENAKTRQSRLVPFSAYTCRYLRELSEENNHHFVGSEYLFLSIRGTQMTHSGIKGRLERLGELSGVSKEISVTCHYFRHTAATNMLKAGMDLYSLSRILGHANMDMTRRYLSLTPRDLSQKHDQFSPIQQFRTRKRRF